MPQIRYVEHAERSPSGCFLCGRQTGPFIDCNVPRVQFWTPTGSQIVDTWVYVCVGIEENPGCAVQVARMSGLMVDRSMHDDVLGINSQLNGEIAELRGLLSKKTVTVAELQEHGLLPTANTPAVNLTGVEVSGGVFG